MKLDFERWKAVVLASCDSTIDADEILAAAGLIDADYLEDELADLLREIEADLDEAERQDGRKTPPTPPTSS